MCNLLFVLYFLQTLMIVLTGGGFICFCLFWWGGGEYMIYYYIVYINRQLVIVMSNLPSQLVLGGLSTERGKKNDPSSHNHGSVKKGSLYLQ